MTHRTLADLARFERALVVSVNGDGPCEGRLRELGLCSGTEVALDRRAPFGGPMVFSLRGYRLCLRPGDARRVAIGPLNG